MRTSRTTSARTQSDALNYIKFYGKAVLNHYKISYSKFIKKPQKERLHLALQIIPATAKVVSIAFKIPLESQCRRKRALQERGLLKVSYRDVQCKYTSHYARLLTCDAQLFNSILFKDV